MALPVYVVAGILLMPILRDRTKGQLQLIALGHRRVHLHRLDVRPPGVPRQRPQRRAATSSSCFSPCRSATWPRSRSARLFGRHKMRPNISPNKTWEGSLGALAVGMALPWIFRFSLAGLRHARAAAGRPHRRHRLAARRPLHQRHQARHRHQGHGHAHRRPRRRARSHRQPDLRRAALLPHDALLRRDCE